MKAADERSRSTWANIFLVAMVAACGRGPELDEVDVVSADLTAEALVFSTSADRSAPKPIGGQTIRGEAFVFLQLPSAQSVEFFLDGVFERTERVAPYDFAGGLADGSAAPFVASEHPAGAHTVTARVTTTRNRQYSVSATFTVAHAAPPVDAGTTPPADGGVSTTDAGTPPKPADAGSQPPSDAGASVSGCDVNGPIGYQQTPGVKTPTAQLTRMGELTLTGQTITKAYITGAVRGYGTIKDSVIAAQTYIAVMNQTNRVLTLEDVTVGVEGQKMGDLAVASEGAGIDMVRVRIVGYADCLRNGPLSFENSWCTTTQQSPADHNDGYQAYGANESKVSVRCSNIDNLAGGANGGLFHADGSQVNFTVENVAIRVGANWCLRLHSSAAHGELPAGDSVDDSRVSVVRNVTCTGGTSPGFWVDAIPVGVWQNVTYNGAPIAKP